MTNKGIYTRERNSLVLSEVHGLLKNKCLGFVEIHDNSEAFICFESGFYRRTMSGVHIAEPQNQGFCRTAPANELVQV
jgi:hypothetical protein